MIRRGLVLFTIFFLGCTSIIYSQDTVTVCNCYLPLDTAAFQQVPFTLGTDSVTAPYYENNFNATHAIKLPFKFCFYGKTYDSVYIGNKGNITFGAPIFKFSTTGFPAGADTAMIAPLWCDIGNRAFGPEPPTVGETWYKITPRSLTVNWYNAKYYVFDCDLYDLFKVTITDGTDSSILGGNNVMFCYSTLQWACSDSTGGTMGFGGAPAVVGINKGDGSTYAVITKPQLPGLAYNGPAAANNGLYWLENKSFALNTCVTENNIPPVLINPNKCDTLEICPYDSTTFTTMFLCSEQGQKATLTFSAPGMSSVKLDTTSKSNSIYTGVLHIYANVTDVGTHTITVTATDNSTPNQVATYPVVVIVDACLGINEVKDEGNFNIYPNANNGLFTLELAKGLPSDNNQVRIYDINGKEIYSMETNDMKTAIDLSSQPKGIYFLKLFRGNIEVGAKKIVVE